ncbi:hypothetical protein [Streptomyces decoyicus]
MDEPRALCGTVSASQSTWRWARGCSGYLVEDHMTTPEQNKALVLEAFDMLFNKRD